MTVRTSVVSLLLAVLVAGCSLPPPPAHGQLATLKEHERLDLRAGAETTIEIGSFSNDTYVEYSFDEREDGKMDACILPENEVGFWTSNNEAHGTACVTKERAASRSTIVGPGHYYLAFRCRNTIDTCVSTYDLRTGPPA